VFIRWVAKSWFCVNFARIAGIISDLPTSNQGVGSVRVALPMRFWVDGSDVAKIL